jgi:hypothetical protein
MYNKGNGYSNPVPPGGSRRLLGVAGGNKETCYRRVVTLTSVVNEPADEPGGVCRKVLAAFPKAAQNALYDSPLGSSFGSYLAGLYSGLTRLD